MTLITIDILWIVAPLAILGFIGLEALMLWFAKLIYNEGKMYEDNLTLALTLYPISIFIFLIFAALYILGIVGWT